MTTLNIAHRGASAAAPQNTLAAFQKARELGADAVELDVQLCADGVPVVIHDATVDATTEGHGRVSDLTLAQLRQLDAGAYFDAAFAGQRIPTLDEVLESIAPYLILNIELKSLALCSNRLERAVVGLIEAHASADRVLISSFNPLSLRRVKQLAPRIRTGLLYTMDLPLPLRRAWLAPVAPHEARHPHHTMVDDAYMAWARQRGYQVNVWTVDDPAEMRRLIELDVDGIITNLPGVLRRAIDAHAQA